MLYYDSFHKLEKETGISQKIHHRIFVKSCSKVILSHRVGNWWVHWSWGLGSTILYFYWATVSCISVFWFAYLIFGLHAQFLFFRTQWYEIAYHMFFTRRELQQSSRVRTFPCWHWQWTHVLGILCQNQPPCPKALSRNFRMITFAPVNKHFKGVEWYNGGVKAISKETYCSLETIKKPWQSGSGVEVCQSFGSRFFWYGDSISSSSRQNVLLHITISYWQEHAVP